MHKYIDKLTVFILCTVFYLQYRTDIYSVVPLIIVIIFGAFMSYIDNELVRLITALSFFALSFYWRPAICFFCRSSATMCSSHATSRPRYRPLFRWSPAFRRCRRQTLFSSVC